MREGSISERDKQTQQTQAKIISRKQTIALFVSCDRAQVLGTAAYDATSIQNQINSVATPKILSTHINKITSNLIK